MMRITEMSLNVREGSARLNSPVFSIMGRPNNATTSIAPATANAAPVWPEGKE